VHQIGGGDCFKGVASGDGRPCGYAAGGGDVDEKGSCKYRGPHSIAQDEQGGNGDAGAGPYRTGARIYESQLEAQLAGRAIDRDQRYEQADVAWLEFAVHGSSWTYGSERSGGKSGGDPVPAHPKCNELPGWQAQRSRGDFRFGNTRQALSTGANKKADSGSCPPLRGPALRLGLRLCIYFPELEADAGCEFAFGMLTYPLTVSLPTLLTTNSSGILVPLR